MKSVLGFLVGIIILFSIIHWSGIYTNSIENAITKNGWDKPFLNENLNDDTTVSFIKEQFKIRVVICSHGSLGWKVKGNSGALSFSRNIPGLNGKKGSFKLKNKTINYMVGIITDNKVDHITFNTKNAPQANRFNLFTTKDGTRIFYTITNKDLNGLTYTAYSKENKVLYKGH